jgi:hypothetical protein
MARDEGLEELIEAELDNVGGLSQKAMFGGLCWMLHGNLLCAARDDGLLVRLGKGHEGWAIATDDIVPMISGKRPMSGWVRAGPDAYGDDALRRRLLDAALTFVRTLPAK